MLIDTHTADGLKVGREQALPGVPTVVMETAQPAKFADTIREAVGFEPARPRGLETLEDLPRRYTVMKADAEAVKAYIVRAVGTAAT